MYQSHDMWRLAIDNMSKAAIFLFSVSPTAFQRCLLSRDVQDTMQEQFLDRNAKQPGPFRSKNMRTHDPDYDRLNGGVTFRGFLAHFGPWCDICFEERSQEVGDDFITSNNHLDMRDLFRKVCFAITLLARRALAEADTGAVAMSPEASRLERFFALFRGDVRVSSEEDEWVFVDVSILDIISKAVRDSVHLQLRFFTDPAEITNLQSLRRILVGCQVEDKVFAAAETDPAWEAAIKRSTPRLVSMRRRLDQETGAVDVQGHKILMLTLRTVKFTLVKVNREAVRGLWSAQQHELIFLQNQNSERASIQSMPSLLRNLINQSCDVPSGGYPVYVSPVTTSYRGASEFATAARRKAAAEGAPDVELEATAS